MAAEHVDVTGSVHTDRSDGPERLHAFTVRTEDGYRCRWCGIGLNSYLVSDPHPACTPTGDA